MAILPAFNGREARSLDASRALVSVLMGLWLALVPAAANSYESSDYFRKVASIKVGYLDRLWNAKTGQYESDEGQGQLALTWLNAFMMQTTAILSGHGRASDEDITRARLVLSKLLASPLKPSPLVPSYTWTHLMDGTSDRHEAVDQPVAEALYFAWKYRAQLRLDKPMADAIVSLLTTDRRTRLYGGQTLQVAATMDNQNLAKWLLNRLTYAKLAGANVDGEIRVAVHRFIDHIDRPFGKANTGSNEQSALFPDYGWRYIGSMEWPSLEYGAMSLGGFLLFMPEIKQAAAIEPGDLAKVKAWQRQEFGLWQRNGYPNWDTVMSDHRIHALSYWMWSLRGLTGIARAAVDEDVARGAKYMLDRSIDAHTTMDRWAGDPPDGAVSSSPYGVKLPAAAYGRLYNNTKASSNAKFAMELAIAVDLGVADSQERDPGNIWDYHWSSGGIKVSTPFYSAASNPFAPKVGAWGVDSVQSPGDGVSRIALPTGEILTSLGGYGLDAFSFQATNGTSVVIDSGSPDAGRPDEQSVWVDGARQTPKAYDTQPMPTAFRDTLRSVVTRKKGGYRSDVETVFHQDHISQNLEVRGGPVSVVQSFPLRKGSVIDCVSNGAKTAVWDGVTAREADLTNCRYVHIRWERLPDSGRRAGLLLIPRSGAMVTVAAQEPKPSNRQPDQGRSLLIYADKAGRLGYDILVTDGTDAGAVKVYGALGR